MTDSLVKVFVVLLAALVLFTAPAMAEKPWPKKNGVPLPKSGGDMDAKMHAFAKAGTPEKILGFFLDEPYVEDGCIDENGWYTYFADGKALQKAHGLNCSGFVLGASRILLKKNMTVAEAKKDRAGDSGPSSAMGEDWDFGWDLIMNISEGHTRTMLLPGGKTADPAQMSGKDSTGFDLHDEATWKELPARIKEGRLYLVSFNKPVKTPGYTMQHYHVALFFRTSAENWYIYNTTRQSKKVYRRDLGSQKGLDAFLKAFANTGKVRKSMCIIEVVLPDGEVHDSF